MAAPKKATATAVSRALTEAGMTKSQSATTRIRGYRRATRGFVAQNEKTYDYETRRSVPNGTVTVTWASGNFMLLAGDAERGAAQLAKCAEILTAKGYTVVTDTNGSTSLTVTRPA